MINLITDLISFTQPTNLDKESLSVIESISKIQKVVNECITQFNNLENKTDEDYQNFLNQITNYKNEVIKIVNDIKNDNNSFKNEFREIIKSLENFNVSLEIIKKQSEFIQDLAKQNQDAIDKGTIATKDEINKINTTLEHIENSKTRVSIENFTGSDVEKMNYAINSFNNTGGVIELKSGKEYYINETIYLPYNVSIEGNNATIKVDNNCAFKNDFIFFINVNENGNTIKPNGGEVCEHFIKNINFVNDEGNKHPNVKAFYTRGGRTQIEYIRLTNFYKCFLKNGNSNNDYTDHIKLAHIDMHNSLGNEYLIEITYNGDGLELSNISNTSNKNYNYNGIKISNCHGGKISNCINGNIELYHCSAFTVENLHLEVGSIHSTSSSCTFSNIHQWYRGEVSLIIDGGDSDKRNKTIVISNYNIVYMDNIYKVTNYTNNHFNCIFKNANISINNLYRCSLNKAFFGRVSPVKISFNGTSIDNKWEELSHLYSKNSIIINTTIKTSINSVRRNGDYAVFGDLMNSDGNYTNFFKNGTTYYYKVAFILGNKSRCCGSYHVTKSKNITKDNQKIHLYFETNRDISDYTLRIYRGTSTAEFTHYVDTSISSGGYITDYGYCLDNGEMWREVDHDTTYNDYVYRQDLHGLNVTCFGSSKPDKGSWINGDIFIKMYGARVGDTIGWFYNGSTWLSMGVYSE